MDLQGFNIPIFHMEAIARVVLNIQNRSNIRQYNNNALMTLSRTSITWGSVTQQPKRPGCLLCMCPGGGRLHTNTGHASLSMTKREHR